MAAIGLYADAAAFGFTAFSQESKPSQPTQEPEEDPYRHVTAKLKDVQSPWSCLQEDFIVIAEFSEVTGPIPLLTIPSHIAHDKAFNINDFIMKIMSVDYHANPSGHFQTCEDVQVLLTETGLSAYVHYTMLHDLKARGWVRPLCIAYISSDSEKLQKNFDAYRKMFLQVTQIMKFDNCHWFMDEILKVIHSLKETQGQYFNYKKREDDGVLLNDEEQFLLDKIDIDLLVHQYTEYKHLLHAVEPLLKNISYQNTVDIWKAGLVCAELDIPQVASYLCQLRCEMETVDELPMVEIRLKSILGLCPWGFAAAVWSLLSTVQSHTNLKLEKQLATFAFDKNTTSETTSFVDNALKNTEFLNLLITITQPLDKHDCLRGSCDGNEGNTMSSLNEATASSSYHSVAGSISDLPKDFDQISDGESFLDISETFHTDNSDSESDNETYNEDDCIWNCTNEHLVHSGHRLLKFFRTFDKVACHILYSLLVGRTVVISGNETSGSKVARLIAVLSRLVPVSDKHRLHKLAWHCGILVSSHITTHQLIGLCVPERLSIHDMISPKDKNTITILDIETKQLFGPAYSGNLLASLEKTVLSVNNDYGLRLFLRYVAASIEEKLFVYKITVLESLSDKPNDNFKDSRHQGCDIEIIKFFSSLKSC